MAAFLRFARRHPCFTAGASLGTRYFVGDVGTQLVIEKKESLDLRRTLCFTSFGFLMGAGPIYAWMGHFMPRVVAPRLHSTAAKCAAFAFGDICVFMPLIYFPCFYTLREFIYHGDDATGSSPGELVDSAMRKLRSNFVDDMKSATMVMLPQDVLMQTLIPPHMRVPFISVTGLLWVYLLSSSRGTDDDDDTGVSAEAEPAVIDDGGGK